VSSDSELILAVDGGGTKTVLAFANRDGELVFLDQGASSNPMDNERWREQLSQLFTAAGHLLPSTVHAVFGLPGFGEIKRFDELMRSAAADLSSAPHHVMNDVELALDGAFVGRPGVLLLAGTGSMAMARDAGGQVLRVGGWGEIFGDEGSAFWIGREALSATSQALDGRTDAVDFANGILSGLGLDIGGGCDALMSWCYGSQRLRSAVAGVARFVDALARSGNRTALAILNSAADHLSAHLTAIRRCMKGAQPATWSYAGGVFESRVIGAMLARRHGKPRPPRLPPIAGGLWRAAREAGWRTDDAWIEKLAESTRRNIAILKRLHDENGGAV
jgi:N-acetylglucosamine kinase-like BadF-type ATPase